MSACQPDERVASTKQDADVPMDRAFTVRSRKNCLAYTGCFVIDGVKNEESS